MKDNDVSGSIYDFMREAGIEVPQLVEAGIGTPGRCGKN